VLWYHIYSTSGSILGALIFFLPNASIIFNFGCININLSFPPKTNFSILNGPFASTSPFIFVCCINIKSTSPFDFGCYCFGINISLSTKAKFWVFASPSMSTSPFIIGALASNLIYFGIFTLETSSVHLQFGCFGININIHIIFYLLCHQLQNQFCDFGININNTFYYRCFGF